MMKLIRPAQTESPDAEEQAMVDRCRQGDVQAFGWVVNRNMKRAYFSALGLVADHEDALDLSQDAFVRAYRAIQRFEPGHSFFTWYYKILRNLCLNHLRTRARFTSLDSADESAQGETWAHKLPDGLADPSVLAERNELNKQLWKAIAALKPEDREILLLREMEDCSYSEIAARLEIPAGTVMSRLFAARRHLRQKMEGLL